MSQVIVPGRGPIPALWMILGEAPGKVESLERKPFVGPSGRAQETYLNRHGVSTKTARLDNIVGLYQPGNPDPSPSLIAEWTPRRLADIRKVSPKLIVAVGRFSARWFLGEQADLDLVWGIPLPAGVFDSSRGDRACGAAVVCIYHPAYALHAKNDDDAVRALTLVAAGYERVARYVKDIEAGREIEVRCDLFAGHEQYQDVTGRELASELKRYKAGKGTVIGFDTEGTPDKPWSLQVSLNPGTGMVLRPVQKDFSVGITALQAAADKGAIFSTHSFSTPEHGCAYEILMARAMGLRLERVWDTMAAAYLLRLELQGAKDLAFRWCGMRMASFMDTVGTAAREKQVDWLCEVLKHDWPKPEQRVEVDNGGVAKLKTPKAIPARVEAMLVAVYAKGDDPRRRWDMMDSELKKQVEQKLGPMPGVSLDDIPLDKAVYYAARDADWQWRGYYALHTELERLGLLGKMDQLMGCFSLFEAMQAGGMPISRARLEALEYRLSTDMDKLRARMSAQFCGGRKFNPNAQRDVVGLMIRRGLQAAKRTKKGAVSISKQSIEHLRYQDEAMAMRTDWNEKRHNKNTYVDKLLEMVPEGVDQYVVHCNIKPNATTTSRIAGALLLAKAHQASDPRRTS